MNQEELGALVRVGKNAVGAWEAGRSRPDVSSVPVICEALDLSLEEFFGFSGESAAYPALDRAEAAEVMHRYAALNPYHRKVVMREMEMLREMQESAAVPPRKVIRIFRNELAASAGPGETLDSARGEEIYLYSNSSAEEADEIIRVNGNSMEPTYKDGEMVLVKHASSVRPGEIGVFINGNTGYIKEYRKDGLHSHNPAYPVMVFPSGDEVRCVGKVLGPVRSEEIADEKSYREWTDYERKER
jgi:transcriptional regulator with XRE-family HTH domain